MTLLVAILQRLTVNEWANHFQNRHRSRRFFQTFLLNALIFYTAIRVLQLAGHVPTEIRFISQTDGWVC